jgi:hypothetical protein
MVLTEDQDAKFRDLCEEIKPGEFGRVIVSFVGKPSNLVQITGEKNYRFDKDTQSRQIMRGKSESPITP